ncbi:MAG: Fic family protein [bacterium]|nr:Fic family protein [bacterium]
MLEFNLDERQGLQAIYRRIDDKKTTLEKGRPLSSIALEKIKETLAIEWTYNSNSIEGNTLTLNETKVILEDGLTVHGKSLREHFEAHNHAKAIDYLYRLLKPNYALNAGDIVSLHKIVLNSIEDHCAGQLRNSAVRITGANFVPPNARKVPDLLDELIEYVKHNPQGLNTIELATVFHHRFVWIHPFLDGNGRTVRLVMNLLLMRSGFPPAIILKNDRKKYYDALNQANNGNYQKLLLLMCQALERTLNIYINAMPNSPDDYSSIANLVEEEKMPYGPEYISLLARRGKIDAYKEGKNWYTSKAAVEKYVKERLRNR